MENWIEFTLNPSFDNYVNDGVTLQFYPMALGGDGRAYWRKPRTASWLSELPDVGGHHQGPASCGVTGIQGRI
jgi:hypothetical protein